MLPGDFAALAAISTSEWPCSSNQRQPATYPEDNITIQKEKSNSKYHQTPKRDFNASVLPTYRSLCVQYV
jgi:hypothetical protein